MLLVFTSRQRWGGGGGGGGSRYITEKLTQMNLAKLVDVIHHKDCLNSLGSHGERGWRLAVLMEIET